VRLFQARSLPQKGGHLHSAFDGKRRGSGWSITHLGKSERVISREEWVGAKKRRLTHVMTVEMKRGNIPSASDDGRFYIRN